jgi:Flp pilus assembly protein TadD
LGLGDHLSANEELEKITPRLRSHPEVLAARWVIYAKAGNWQACSDIAAAVVTASPENSWGWIHKAYSLRRVPGGGIESAKVVLLEAQQKFPKEPTIAYNLACYDCQLGNLNAARKWLESAIALAPDPRSVKLAALEDPDLERFWAEIGEI